MTYRDVWLFGALGNALLALALFLGGHRPLPSACVALVFLACGLLCRRDGR